VAPVEVLPVDVAPVEVLPVDVAPVEVLPVVVAPPAPPEEKRATLPPQAEAAASTMNEMRRMRTVRPR